MAVDSESFTDAASQRNMYDCVPNFSTENEYPFLNSFGLVHKPKSKMFDDIELMELVWKNGEVALNNQNQKTTHNGEESAAPLQQSTNNELFIHEDEMASWLLPFPTGGTTSPNTSARPQTVSNNLTVTRTTATVIDSNETPTTTEPRDFSGARGSGERVGMTSGDSETSTSAELPPRVPKRKIRPKSDVDSEDIEQDVPNVKKQAHGSPSNKISRAAEVHNLSERRRRDRINEKMKTLQDLIPRCNKTDKASMLDDAIDYLKSLQQTVQMMSMGYGMVPLMYPGVQPYMPSMPTGISGPIISQPIINRPIMPYPMQAPISSEQPMFPAFHLQPASVSENLIIHTTSHPDPLLNFQVSNEQQISNFHLYQQYLGAQAAFAQNQAAMQQIESNPKGNITEAKNHDDTQYSG